MKPNLQKEREKVSFNLRDLGLYIYNGEKSYAEIMMPKKSSPKILSSVMIQQS